MATIRPEVLLIAGAAVVAGLLLAGKNAGAVGSGLGSAAVDMVDGVLSGAVVSVGSRLGVPEVTADTRTEGQRALDAGNYWDASFLLPAGDFIAGSWNRIFN